MASMESPPGPFAPAGDPEEGGAYQPSPGRGSTTVQRSKALGCSPGGWVIQ